VTHPSPARVLVLHGLRLKGFADADALSAVVGVPSDEVRRHLDELAADELVLRRDGRLSGWALTPGGRKTHAELVAIELDESGRRSEVERAYRDFLALNRDLLEACTRWQLRPVEDRQVPNDHSDPEYDSAVVERLRGIDDAVQPVCARLGAALARFGAYGGRLARARRKVEEGEGEWFTRPVIDSYHTVWFELHEDLLVTLGIERSHEGSATGAPSR